VDNAGVLVASGLITGEALTGLLIALFVLRNIHLPQIFHNPPVMLGFGVLALLAIYMIQIPLRNAGSPDEPAPPTAMM
jgi:threonine/homoserine/homoserine lactone efflux protein